MPRPRSWRAIMAARALAGSDPEPIIEPRIRRILSPGSRPDQDGDADGGAGGAGDGVGAGARTAWATARGRRRAPLTMAPQRMAPPTMALRTAMRRANRWRRPNPMGL